MQSINTQKPWLVITGASRGIGNALRNQLSDRYNFIEIVRTTEHHSENNVRVTWDLSKQLDEKTRVTLTNLFQKTGVAGILHCAGTLGPLGGAETLAHSKTYWSEHLDAYQINVCAPLDLLSAALPYLKAAPNLPAPFIFHLSSGAANKPYVGWETYCITKAACLMSFKTLAKRFDTSTLLSLSVAPGTVMTDMMKRVLSGNKTQFPEVEKFYQLQKEGKLVEPTVPADAIDRFLHGPVEVLNSFHGELFDVRQV